MKRLPILVLLFSVAQFCGATSPPALCLEKSGDSAARSAVYHISQHHDHGYKFKLNAVQSANMEEVNGINCNIELQLDLLETTCHNVNPKDWYDCSTREESDRDVMAKCLVKMTVTNDVPLVTKYDCDTKLVKSNSEMMSICPDCPFLVPLNSTEGLKSVHEAVKKANQDHSHQHYYVLHEVGRIKAGYMFHSGTGYWAEFALVESHCPAASKIVSEACKPLCPDRAGHALCKSSYTSVNGLSSVQCEFYPALNTTPLGDGEQEPDCMPLHAPGSGGPVPVGPPHSPPHHGSGGPVPVGPPHPPHGSGAPSPPHGSGPPPPPPHGSGGPVPLGPVPVGPPPPPPHGSGGPVPVGPPHSPPHHGSGGPSQPGLEMPHPMLPHHCHGLLENFDPALHPICPWQLAPQHMHL